MKDWEGRLYPMVSEISGSTRSGILVHACVLFTVHVLHLTIRKQPYTFTHTNSYAQKNTSTRAHTLAYTHCTHTHTHTHSLSLSLFPACSLSSYLVASASRAL